MSPLRFVNLTLIPTFLWFFSQSIFEFYNSNSVIQMFTPIFLPYSFFAGSSRFWLLHYFTNRATQFLACTCSWAVVRKLAMRSQNRSSQKHHLRDQTIFLKWKRRLHLSGGILYRLSSLLKWFGGHLLLGGFGLFDTGIQSLHFGLFKEYFRRATQHLTTF